MRVTYNMMHSVVLSNIMHNQERLLDLNRQASTGKAVTKASDAPVDMGRVLNYREVISKTEQYSRNISRVTPWLSTTESVMREVSDLLQGAKTLAVGLANDSQDADSRAAGISEVQGIIDSLIRLGNTKVGNSYIFGGTRTTNAPFLADGTYIGNSTLISAEINEGIFQGYNVPGSDFLIKDLDPLISEPNSNTGKLAFAESGMASGMKATLSNWVLSQPDNETTYDLFVKLGDGIDHRIQYTTSDNATQAELGAGLALAIAQDEELSQALDADYSGGVLTLTAKDPGADANAYTLRTLTSPFSSNHLTFGGVDKELNSGFTFDASNESLVFTEKGYAASGVITSAPANTEYTMEIEFGDIKETITASFASAPTQDQLGQTFAQNINANANLNDLIIARYDTSSNELTVAARSGVPSTQSFSMSSGSGSAFSSIENEMSLSETTLTVNLTQDSDAVTGVVYDGGDVADFIARSLEAVSETSGFGFDYNVMYDFVDDQQTKKRFTLSSAEGNSETVVFNWADSGSTIRETLGFAEKDSKIVTPGDAHTSDSMTAFNVLTGVNDTFRINVDGAGFETVILDQGTYTAEQLANEMQSKINAAGNDVSVTYSEGQGGHFAIVSESGGPASSLRLMAGSGAGRESDFLRTVRLSSESGMTFTATPGVSSTVTVTDKNVVNLGAFQNIDSQQVEISYSTANGWVVANAGDFNSLSITSSDANEIGIDFDGDRNPDIVLDVSNPVDGDEISVNVARTYYVNSYYEDGTDSVLLRDLNGGDGVRMDAPSLYQVGTDNNAMVIEEDGAAAVTVTIPPGSYTGEELAQIIQQTLNNTATLGDDYTVSYSDGNYAFSKTTGSFALNWNDSASTSLGLLGFQAEQTVQGQMHTSDYPVRTLHVSVMDRAGNLARVDMAQFEISGSGASQNNVIQFENPALTIEIPPGYYSGDQLASVIASRMSEESGNGYDVQFRDGAFSISRNDGTAFEIDWSVTGGAAETLGFDPAATPSSSVTHISETPIPELTVNDLIERLNEEFTAAGVGITTLVNASGNGLEFADKNSSINQTTNMRVFRSDTADDLGLFSEDRLITIDDHTNTVYFSIPSAGAGTTYQAVLQPGTYDGNSLANVLKGAFERATDVDNPSDITTAEFQIDFLPERNVFAIIPSTEMEIHWASNTASGKTSTAAAALGMTRDWSFTGAGPFSPLYSDESAGAEGRPGDVQGTDLNPALRSYTGIGDLYGGGGIELGEVRITNGNNEAVVDLEGSQTIREVMYRINASGVGARVQINSHGTSLKMESLIDGTVPVVLSEEGDETSQLLGLAAGQDILETLGDFKQALEDNDQDALGNVISNLQASIDRIVDHVGVVGSRLINVEETADYLDTYRLDLLTLKSETEDVDATEAITQLLNQEEAFQASLQLAARLVNISLLNFLS